VLHLAIAVFLAGALCASLAQSVEQLIAFRALQGVGAGGVVALVQVVLGDSFSARDRARYTGFVTAVYVAASAAGPVVAGLLADDYSWRWIFLLYVPFGAFAYAVTRRLLPGAGRRPGGGLDVAGAALLAGAVTCLLLLTSRNGASYEWSRVRSVELLAALVLLAAFVWRERRTPKPILPLSLFANSICTLSAVASFLIGVVMFASIFFLPLFFQLIGGIEPSRSGLLLVPLMAGMVVTTSVAGTRMAKSGRYKRYPVAGTATMAVAVCLLATVEHGTPFAVGFLYTLLLGLGMGAATQVLIIAAQNAAPAGQLGVVTSTITLFRLLGGAFGTAMFGAVLAAKAGSVPTTAAVESAMHVAYLLSLPVALAALAVTCLIEERPLGEVPRAAAPALSD
jgi:MFS family permease